MTAFANVIAQLTIGAQIMGAAVAQAQFPTASPTTYNVWPYSNFSWREARHSSTLAEGVQRGWGVAQLGNAQVILAQGVAAQAQAQAEHQYLCDRLYVAERLEQVRRQRAAALAAERSRPKPTPAEISELQRKCLPQRLSLSQLGPDGQIEWPELLLADEYRQPRQALDELFRQRAYGSAPKQRAKVGKALESEAAGLQAELLARVNNYPSADYIVAKRFIESLRLEARCDSPIMLTSR